MPWYGWLIMVLALGSILGGLLLLRDSATRINFTPEQRTRVEQRNREADAQDHEQR